MMPDGIAFVLTSSNERGGVPSAKKRFGATGLHQHDERQDWFDKRSKIV